MERTGGKMRRSNGLIVMCLTVAIALWPAAVTLGPFTAAGTPSRGTTTARNRALVGSRAGASLTPPTSWIAPSGEDVSTPRGYLRLQGEVNPALARAMPAPAAETSDRLAVTIVLKRRDQPGFERLVEGMQDPRSPLFHRSLTAEELTRRYGPRSDVRRELLEYLRGAGLRPTAGETTAMTISASGSRLEVERAFNVRIRAYRVGGHLVYANDRDPALPAGIARNVDAVIGLSSLSRPLAPNPLESVETFHKVQEGDLAETCYVAEFLDNAKMVGEFFKGLAAAEGSSLELPGDVELMKTLLENFFNYRCAADELNLVAAYAGSLGATARVKREAPSAAAASTFGAGQKIGLLEFGNYNASDVSDFLAMNGSEPSLLSNLSEVNVAGGAGPPSGAGESETLLDIDAALSLAPHAQVVVYDGPFAGGASFATMFEKMIEGGVTVISNSWTECEDQTSEAEVRSLDHILEGAAAHRISVLNASGDSGSTCLDGSPNTIGVPADSPHATAVGGTSATPGPGGTYGSEAYWNGTGSNPPTGQGGFGASRFFTAPAYQAGLSESSMRTIPDLAVNADPAQGYFICQADNGGCPNGQLYGGTSVAAPIVAAFVADLNHDLGENIGELNPLLYPLAGSAFHSALSMGSDFKHVGLGSPDLDALYLALGHKAVGPVSETTSFLVGEPANGVSADGITGDSLVAALLDASGNSVAGKQVSLVAGTHAGTVTITPASGTSSATNGTVAFVVTDTVPETVTFTATDTTDGVTLPTFNVTFVSPPADSGSISASPESTAANGVFNSTITVTLQTSGKGAPGKTVMLTPNAGTHSTIVGPTKPDGKSPAVTDANGQVRFTVSDSSPEEVTYTATDVTDGHLRVPGAATVKFTGSGEKSAVCGSKDGEPPTAAAGFAFSNFATNFTTGSLFNECVGPIGVAFNSLGQLYVMEPGTIFGFHPGLLYKFSAEGGTADSSTLVGTPDEGGGPPFPSGLAFGRDGELYVAEQCGNVWQLNPANASRVRLVASKGTSMPCPVGIAVDPLTGDLFVTAAGQGTTVARIAEPAGASPSVTLYTNVESGADGIAFAPDGTMYLAGENGNIYSVTGTNGPSTPIVSTLAHVPGGPDGIAVQTAPASSHAQALFVNTNSGTIVELGNLGGPVTQTTVFMNGTRGDFETVGPDGCLYATQSDRIIKLTNADGTCSLATESANPQLSLAPQTVSPPPSQGTFQTLTATLRNVAKPEGIPVRFVVQGRNTQSGVALTNASGVAAFTYQGIESGEDTIQAFAESEGITLASHRSTVDWSPGPHATFMDLNLSPTAGSLQAPTKLVATLDDVTANPPTPVVGVAVKLELGGQSCEGNTDGSGKVSCTVSPSGLPGIQALRGVFAGNSEYAGTSMSQPFAVTTSLISTTEVATLLSADGNSGATLEVVEGKKVSDRATLEGVNSGTATGKVSYTVYSDSECSKLVQEAGTAEVASGIAGASQSEELSAGTYYWQASYTGDATHSRASSACGSEVLTVKRSAAPGGTCGTTSVGKVSEALLANLKRVQRCTLPVNGTVGELSVYLAPSSTSGQQLLEGVLYADKGGSPGALLATTAPLSFTSTSVAGWQKLAFPARVKLAAGQYWIGILSGATSKVADAAYANIKGAEDYNANAYASGPTNPFGRFSSANEQVSLYASWMASGPQQLGKTSVGKSTDSSTAERKRANRYTLPIPGTVSKLSIYLAPTSASGEQVLKGVIYSDSAGSPGALVATSEQLTFNSTNAAGWYDLSFPTPVKLSPGSYWIGTLDGPASKVAGVRFDSVAGSRTYNVNAYVSGASNPFGTATKDGEQMSLYATYMPG
jgi:hypothetical protein